MSSVQLGRAIDGLRRCVGGRKESDSRLLADFVATGDQAAFEALIKRHGPLVLGVCRRVLVEPTDADDAFQATFLVLVRKASTIAKGESLGSWLHGVAYRVASKARSLAAKRRFHERRALPMTVANAEHEAAVRDLRPVLDEELRRLPAKYREPLVLCYLQGKSKEEIARQLGWPHGTVSGRLARAREVLRGRLTGRGLALAAVPLGAVLAEAAASAAVPAPLLASTLQTASVFAAGTLAAAGISAHVATLTEGVLHTMFLTKLKVIIAVAAAFGLVLTGAGALACYGWAGEAGSVKLAVAQAAKEKKPAGSEKSDAEKIIGSWHVASVERDGQRPEGDEAAAMNALRFVFTKDTLTVNAPDGKEGPMKFILDANKKPTVIELTRSDEKVVRGIYKFDGETLILCIRINDEEGVTPTEFSSKGDKKLMLFVLKRGEAPKPPPEAAAKISEARQRQMSQNNLKQIGLAFHNYHNDQNRFPGAAIRSKDGKALLSWRVAILPYIEQDPLFRAFNKEEPWDSEHNKALIAKMPKLYMLPGKKSEEGHTHYRVFVGKGTLFDQNQGRKMVDITDGTSNTILVAEATDPAIWTKPDDLAYAEGAGLPKLGGHFKNGYNVLICDGSVRFVSDKVDEGVLRLYITRADGKVVQPLNPAPDR